MRLLLGSYKHRRMDKADDLFSLDLCGFSSLLIGLITLLQGINKVAKREEMIPQRTLQC
jgi:hypothetical protein